MGWLGVCLLFVGIALVSNGVSAIIKMDGRSTALINAVTGLIIVGGNLISLGKADFSDTLAYNNIAAGFLFGFTYVFLAAIHMFRIDVRAFGWYSLGVVVFALTSVVSCISVGLIPLACLWAAWAMLWLEGFLELACGVKALGKIFPALSILIGVFAAFIPSLLMLFGAWPV